jgi:peptide/nickel transport system ATP-binding protein
LPDTRFQPSLGREEGGQTSIRTLAEVLNRPRQLLDALPENLARKQTATAVKRGPRTPAAEERPLIELKGLQVHFPIRKGVLHNTVGAVKAVDGIDRTIPRGQILALVGKLGCGKTTLGRAMLRLIEPTAGQALLDGTELTGLKPRSLRRSRHHLQIVFQGPMSSLNPLLTVAGTLTEPMRIHGIGADRDEHLELAAATLAQIDGARLPLALPPRALRRPAPAHRARLGARPGADRLRRGHQCTGRLGPGQDTSAAARVSEGLGAVTLLFITHNIGVVEYVSNWMAVMRERRIVEQGATGEVVGNQGAHKLNA